MDRARSTEKKIFHQKQKEALKLINSERILAGSIQSYASKTMKDSLVKSNNSGVQYLTGRANVFGATTPLTSTTAYHGFDQSMKTQNSSIEKARPQTASRQITSIKKPLQSSSLKNPMTLTQTSFQDFNKSKVLEDLNKFTIKFQVARDKRVLAGQAPNPESREEKSVKFLTQVLNRNESGKTIHSRQLFAPSQNVLLKMKQADINQSLSKTSLQRNQSQFLNSVRSSTMFENKQSQQVLSAYQSQQFQPNQFSSNKTLNPHNQTQSQFLKSYLGDGGFSTTHKLNHTQLAEKTMRSQCLQDYSIKTKYLQSVNPFLSKNLDIQTDFEFTKYQGRPMSPSDSQGVASPKNDPSKVLGRSQPAGKSAPPAKGQQAAKKEEQPFVGAIKEQGIYQIKADEDIERDHLDAYTDNQNSQWISMGLRTKTNFHMSGEKNQKEAQEMSYIPPPVKPIRSNTKGRFNMPINTPSELFVIDKQWERKANPDQYEEHKRRELWDKRMLEKKRNQKILKDKLIEDQMKHQSMSPLKRKI
eukprot:403340871